jgi:hypothetical protein
MIINHFFGKQISLKFACGGSLPHFSKKNLLKDIFCGTSSGAVSRADCEYHLNFALRRYLTDKSGDLGVKKRVFLGTTNSAHVD